VGAALVEVEEQEAAPAAGEPAARVVPVAAGVLAVVRAAPAAETVKICLQAEPTHSFHPGALNKQIIGCVIPSSALQKFFIYTPRSLSILSSLPFARLLVA
jgi:hypothetical protein